MKLIIDINDKMFDTFKKNGIMTFDSLDEYDKDTLARIVANGIPYERPQGEWLWLGDNPNPMIKAVLKMSDFVSDALSVYRENEKGD